MLIKNLSIIALLGLLLTACVTINVYFPAAEAKEAADKIIDKVWGNEKEGEKQPSEKSPDESTGNESNNESSKGNKSSKDVKSPSKENAESPESTQKSVEQTPNNESTIPSEKKPTEESANDKSTEKDKKSTDKPADDKKETPSEKKSKSIDDKESPAPKSESSSAMPTWIVQTLNFLISPAQAAANLDISSPAIQELQARMGQRHQELLQYYNNGAIGLTNSALIVLRDPAKVNLRFRKKISDSVNEENGDRLRLYREIAYANGHPEWEQDIRDTFAQRWIDRAMIGWWYQDEEGNWLRKQPRR